ncbi:MAG: C39 family peptidase, partial [Chloroflexi bacterium]|nr:C39 family peptidase [Chloroflexota bacterium]
PEERVKETEVIEYALEAGYYTERTAPFTSPEGMVNIAEHFANTVSTGRVKTVEEGWDLLKKTLTHGDPVIIDILTRLDDSDSGAHFVVVTGLVIDSKNPNKNKILFNDPLAGTNRWGYWLGIEGVWNAWQNNDDPGGEGWWMVIASP